MQTFPTMSIQKEQLRVPRYLVTIALAERERKRFVLLRIFAAIMLGTGDCVTFAGQ